MAALRSLVCYLCLAPGQDASAPPEPACSGAGFAAGSGTTATTSDTTIMPLLAVGTSSGTIFLVSVASLQVRTLLPESPHSP